MLCGEVSVVEGVMGRCWKVFCLLVCSKVCWWCRREEEELKQVGRELKKNDQKGPDHVCLLPYTL
jgi:hypothetical protein